MPNLSLVVIFCCTLHLPLAAQSAETPSVGTGSLTTDEVAIYRTVLSDYMKDFRDPLPLANVTEPFEQDWRSIVEGCIKGFNPESTVSVAHRIDPPLIAGMKIVVVDPARQMAEVRANDPQNLVRDATDKGSDISDDQLDKTLKKAFESGLFTLSAIVFDREHRNAMVAYSFACGELCGHGNTIALKKVGKKWKIIRTCSSWIS